MLFNIPLRKTQISDIDHQLCCVGLPGDQDSEFVKLKWLIHTQWRAGFASLCAQPHARELPKRSMVTACSSRAQMQPCNAKKTFHKKVQQREIQISRYIATKKEKKF